MAATALFSARTTEETPRTEPRRCTGLLQRRGDIIEDGGKALVSVQQQHREDVLMKGTSREQQPPLEAVPPTPIFNTTAITPNPWSAASSSFPDQRKRTSGLGNKIVIM
jgi:hypothetical protein